jgi:hypothetical protein
VRLLATPGVLDSLRHDPNQPRLRVRPFARQCRQLGQHLRSCCCSFLLVPVAKRRLAFDLFDPSRQTSCTSCTRSVCGILSYLYILIRHSNIVCIRLQIFRCSHHRKLYRPLVTEGFVGPFSHRPDFFDCGNTIVGNENLARCMSAPRNNARTKFRENSLK